MYLIVLEKGENMYEKKRSKILPEKKKKRFSYSVDKKIDGIHTHKHTYTHTPYPVRHFLNSIFFQIRRSKG